MNKFAKITNISTYTCLVSYVFQRFQHIKFLMWLFMRLQMGNNKFLSENNTWKLNRSLIDSSYAILKAIVMPFIIYIVQFFEKSKKVVTIASWVVLLFMQWNITPAYDITLMWLVLVIATIKESLKLLLIVKYT